MVTSKDVRNNYVYDVESRIQSARIIVSRSAKAQEQYLKLLEIQVDEDLDPDDLAEITFKIV